MRIQIVREKHDTPPAAQDILTAAGGLNLYGEPYYKVTWGWNTLAWIGGDWYVGDDEEGLPVYSYQMRLEPKYIAPIPSGGITVDRWFLEKWRGPEELGSPSAWPYNELGGPFPSRGLYELDTIIQTPDGGFLPLTIGLIDYIGGVIGRSKGDRRTPTLYERRDREMRAEAAEQVRCLDILGDTSPFFRGAYIGYGESRGRGGKAR